MIAMTEEIETIEKTISKPQIKKKEKFKLKVKPSFDDYSFIWQAMSFLLEQTMITTVANFCCRKFARPL